MTIPSTAPSGAATWSVDHAAKTITVRVNIAFWPATNRVVNPALVERIVQDIESYWQGAHYKCYRLVVSLTTAIVTQPGEAPDDHFDVGLDTSTIGMRSKVRGRSSPLSDPLSDSDSFTPVRSFADVRAWATLWSTGDSRPGVYAHEFGHLLGADDGYVESEPEQPKVRCHTDDLMFRTGHAVSPQLVTRVVHRSGLDVSGIKCPLELRTTSANLYLLLAELKELSLVARCEDYTAWSDDDAQQLPAQFKGTLSFQGGYLMGDDNADARAVLGAFGLPTGPLANDQPVSYPVTFSVPPPYCKQKEDGSHQTFDVVAPGITVSGSYTWSAGSTVPEMDAAMTVNGLMSVLQSQAESPKP